MNMSHFTLSVFYKAFPSKARNSFFHRKKTLKTTLGLSRQKPSII